MLVLACAIHPNAFARAAEPPAKPPIDACAFLTAAEIAAQLKATVLPGRRDDSGTIDSSEYVAGGTYSSTCFWRLAATAGQSDQEDLSTSQSYVILNVMQWPRGGKARQFLQNFRDAAKRGEIHQTPEPLKIADEALWWGDGVAVCKADRSFGISVHLVGGRDRERKIEEELARRIASRL
jgi:hypothetical protein